MGLAIHRVDKTCQLYSTYVCGWGVCIVEVLKRGKMPRERKKQSCKVFFLPYVARVTCMYVGHDIRPSG